MKHSNEYAFSLYRLAKEQERVEAYGKCLMQVKCVLDENPNYLPLLHSPALPLETRLELIDKAWGETEVKEVLYLIKLLCEKARILTLPQCIEEFFRLKKEAEMRVPVEVCYASPLSENQMTKLSDAIRKQTGKIPEITYRQDPLLIGGIRVTVEDAVWDGSLSAKLGNLKGVIKG